MKITKTQLQQIIKEAKMAEYGKIDAEDGNPPTKIGQGNPDYMEAYNAVLVAKGEDPLPMKKPDQAYLDALQSGSMKPSDHSYNKKGVKEEISDRDKDTMNDVIAELKKAVQAHKSQHERLQAILDRLVDSEG